MKQKSFSTPYKKDTNFKGAAKKVTEESKVANAKIGTNIKIKTNNPLMKKIVSLGADENEVNQTKSLLKHFLTSL